MNFYKHHLGDYDGATAHLSWEEDLAYRRLLSSYYRRELPIPLDPGETFRLLRAATRVQKAAVTRVLHEFFEELPDGWHQKRADEEIAAYQAQASTNRRIAQERTVKRIVHETTTKHTPNQNQEPEPRTREEAAREARPVDKSESKVNGAWWKSNAGIEAKGHELDMPPLRGESYVEYKDRLFEKINAAKKAA